MIGVTRCAALASVAALSAMLGCGPAVVGSTTEPTPEPEAPSPFRFAAHFPHARLTGAITMSSRVELPARYQIVGGWRVELQGGGRATVSERAFLSEPTDARRCGDGFVFITWGGTVAYAPGFAAEARVIGRMPFIDSDPRYQIRVNEGVVLIRERGIALHGPCEGPLRRAEPVRGDAVHRIWGLGSRRLASTSGHDLWQSEDAGETWQRVEIGEQPVGDDITPDGRLRIGEEWRRVDEQGQLAEAEEPSYEERDWRPSEPADEVSVGLEDPGLQATRALLTRRDAARIALQGLRAVRLTDSTFLFTDGSRLFRLEDGVSREVSLDTPAPPSSCELRDHGPSVALVCGRGGVLVPRDGVYAPLPLPLQGAEALHLSDDGRHLVVVGPCTEGAASTPPRVCRADLDGRRDELVLPASSRVVGMQGRDLRLFVESDGVRRAALWSGDAEPRLFPVVARPPEDDRILTMDEMEEGGRRPSPRRGWLPDGAYWEAEWSDGTGVLRVAEEGRSEVIERALPTGAMDLLLPEREWILAFGASTREIWWSEDLGASWRELVTPFEHPQGLRWVLSGDLRFAGARCFRRGCLLGRLWVERAGVWAPTRSSIVDPGAFGMRRGRAPLQERPLRLSCESAGEPEPSPWGEVPSSGFMVNLRTARVHPSAVLRLEVERRAPGATRISWTLPEGRSVAVSRSAWVEDAELPAVRSCGVVVRAASSLVLRCESEPEDVDEEEPGDGDEEHYSSDITFLLVRREGDIRALDTGDNEFAKVRRIGDRLLALSTLGSSTTAAIFDDTGRLLRRRSFAFPGLRIGPGDHGSEPASFGGRPALYRQLEAPRVGLVTAHAQRLDPYAPAVPLTVRPLEVCPGGDGDVRIHRRVDRLVDSDDAWRYVEGWAEISIGAERTCVRAVGASPEERPDSAFSLRPDGDTLVGWADVRDGRRYPLTCRLLPPRRRSL